MAQGKTEVSGATVVRLTDLFYLCRLFYFLRGEGEQGSQGFNDDAHGGVQQVRTRGGGGYRRGPPLRSTSSKSEEQLQRARGALHMLNSTADRSRYGAVELGCVLMSCEWIY